MKFPPVCSLRTITRTFRIQHPELKWLLDLQCSSEICWVPRIENEYSPPLNGISRWLNKWLIFKNVKMEPDVVVLLTRIHETIEGYGRGKSLCTEQLHVVISKGCDATSHRRLDLEDRKLLELNRCTQNQVLR
jgi:hypothetical protein